MNRSRAVVAAVVLIPVALFAGLPVARFLRSDQETLTLDDRARAKAPGKFVRLPDGVDALSARRPAGRHHRVADSRLLDALQHLGPDV